MKFLARGMGNLVTPPTSVLSGRPRLKINMIFLKEIPNVRWGIERTKDGLIRGGRPCPTPLRKGEVCLPVKGMQGWRPSGLWHFTCPSPRLWYRQIRKCRLVRSLMVLEAVIWDRTIYRRNVSRLAKSRSFVEGSVGRWKWQSVGCNSSTVEAG